MDNSMPDKVEPRGGEPLGAAVNRRLPIDTDLVGSVTPTQPHSAQMALRDLRYYRRFVADVTILAALLATLVVLLLPNYYTSTAVLLPSGKSPALGGLTRGLSGQLVDLGLGSMVQAGDPGESSELFPDVLKSRTVGEAVLAGLYTRSSRPGETPFTLYDYFDSDYAFESLYDMARISQDPKTGIITIAVTTPYPDFSQQIAAAFLAELEKFNRERRLTQGMEKASFLDARLAEVKTELDAAENELKNFRSKNMNYAQSSDPEILAELTRLERTSNIKAEVYGLLTQQYELARLEAADQMPIVQVLDAPAVPNRKSGPPRKVILAISIFLAFTGACIVSVGLGPARRIFPESRILRQIHRLASSKPLWRSLKLRRGPENRRLPVDD